MNRKKFNENFERSLVISAGIPWKITEKEIPVRWTYMGLSGLERQTAN